MGRGGEGRGGMLNSVTHLLIEKTFSGRVESFGSLLTPLIEVIPHLGLCSRTRIFRDLKSVETPHG